MFLKSRATYNAQLAKLPLRLVLIVPFVVQIFAAVGLTGYLSLRNGQKAINSLANQLEAETSARIEQHLTNFIDTPQKINKINNYAIKIGLLKLQDLKSSGRYFWKQVRVFDVGYISYALTTGELAAAGYYLNPKILTIDELSVNTQWKNYVYATDNQGNRTKVITSVDYKPFREAWYKDAVQAGKPVWSQIYQWELNPNVLSISASYPFYNDAHNLIGVLGVDLRLTQISDFLRKLKTSPSGKNFILERNGLLVASSSTELPFAMVKGKAERLKGADSKDALIQATARYLNKKFGNLNQIKTSQIINFSLKGERQFVFVSPWHDKHGLDWLIVIAAPESDFMAQINANTHTTILLCLAALGVAIVLGILTSRWITRPILHLSQASIAIASGNLEQKVEVKGIKEVGNLAQSFNKMAGQLRQSFATLEKTNEELEKANQELEQRVDERTTELKAAKEEAEVARVAADIANLAKSEFLANMSHELRTPLNGILGYAQILLQDKSINPKQKDGLNIIYQCGFHLLDLINDILDISKIEAQKLELYSTDFQFERFLTGVQEICRIRAEQKEIDFRYQALNSLPIAVHADEKRLRQVLINLLGNAIKFTDTGSVTLKVGVIADGIRFQVEDTDVGMTSEQLKKIFLPFEQVGENSRKSEGAGLGLTISRKIVEMMGSEIQVESIYRVGSKFWFDLNLPIVKNWTKSEPPSLKQNIVGYQGKRLTILVVDDLWENRSVIVNLLTPIGFAVIEAENGQEGLNKAVEFQPDLIITDLAMPVMNGFEMTQELRQLAAFKDALIIASSASVFSFDREQSREAGCNDFLNKPVQFSELLDQLQHYLGLIWLYEAESQIISETPKSTQFTQMLAPPKEELIALCQAASAGYVLDIQQEANRIKKLDPKYGIFADKVLKLAEEFDDEAIVYLIEQYGS